MVSTRQGSHHQLHPAVCSLLAVIIMAPVFPGSLHAAKPAKAEIAAVEFQEAAALMDAGRFVEAISAYRDAAERFEKAGRPKAHAATLYNLAVACHASGNYKLAFEALDEAAVIASREGDADLGRQIEGLLGAISVFSRKADTAAASLETAIDEAERRGDRESLAWLLNDYAILLAGRNETERAVNTFARADSLATALNLRRLGAKIAINRAMMHLNAAGQYLRGHREFGEEASARADDDYQDQLRQAWSNILAGATRCLNLPDSFDKAMMLITLGESCRSLRDASPLFSENFTERAFRYFESALEVSRKIGNAGTVSYALGNAGALYEERGRIDEAIELTSRARAEAERAHRPEALYQWEWQMARLLRAQGHQEEALAAYRRSREILSRIRHDVAIGFGNRNLGRSFRDAVGGLYFETADLILQSADASENDAEVQSIYREARSVVESFKSAELEDYFQDDCVNLALSRREEVDAVAEDTAVFYIIPLENRTEILVSIGETVSRFTSPVDGAELNELAYQFRLWLEAAGDPTFMKYGRALNDALIAPVASLLSAKKIQTLVFVPDGALRNLPMGALHDGKRFLLERFAIAVSPGLLLMEPKKIPRGEALMIVGALSDGVQGFPSIAAVKSEVDAINRAITPKPRVLLNQTFLKADFTRGVETEPFRIVHVASHGEFSGDSSKSFVLTYDSKLDLDELERTIRPRKFQGEAVELLALSACRTAAGDDRAALGLAGVAVKSGARSALATLWYVDDEATGTIISTFYQLLASDPEISKAEALRRAQVKMLDDLRYQHPRIWAPYLMIGNWL